MGLTATGTTISANGAVVAGNLLGSLGRSTAYQWKNSTLTQIPGSTSVSSAATAVSPDGSVVVGWVGYGSAGLHQAFAWANGTVMTPPSMPSGYPISQATGASNNGSRIVGYMESDYFGTNSNAFIWDQANGLQDLQQVLMNSDGLASALAGWKLTEATAITPDGNTIVGDGTDPQGQQEGWIVHLATSSGHPQTPAITWADPADVVYGTTLGPAQLDASASVPGTFTYSPPAGTLLHAGNNQALSVTFTPTDTADYTTATATVSINVLRATPTITWANPSDIVHGTALGPTQLDASASYPVGGRSVGVPGNFAYSPGAGTILPVGNNQALAVTFTPTDTIDYTGATATVTIDVLPATGPTTQVHGTRVVLTAKPRSAKFGRFIILTAAVESLGHAGAVPTGSVDFLGPLEGTIPLGVPARLRHGKASLRTGFLPVGRDTIWAHYSGDGNFAPSDSATISVTIRAPRSRSRAAVALVDRRPGGTHRRNASALGGFHPPYG
jgi:hypothetical protein